MLRKIHLCVAMLGWGVLAVVGVYLPCNGCPACILGLIEPTASANETKDNKDKPALSGAWVRKGGELTIEFDGKGVMKVCPHGDNKKIAIVFDYTVEEGGRIKVKVADFEGEEKRIEKAKERVPVGLAFSFKWTAKDDAAKLDDLKGKGDVVEHLKMHLEGEYEQKK